MGRKPKSEEPVYSRLELHRVRAGLTRQELADAVDVHYQTVGYLERGEYSPSLSLALRISSALGAPVEQIFSLEPDFAAHTLPSHTRPSHTSDQHSKETR